MNSYFLLITIYCKSRYLDLIKAEICQNSLWGWIIESIFFLNTYQLKKLNIMKIEKLN